MGLNWRYIVNKGRFTTKKMIVNWFGERGDEIKTSWIEDWFVDDSDLYIKWSKKASSSYACDEGYSWSRYCWKSLDVELDDEFTEQEIEEIKIRRLKEMDKAKEVEDFIEFLHQCDTLQLAAIIEEIRHISPLVGFVSGNDEAFCCKCITVIDDDIHIILDSQEVF